MTRIAISAGEPAGIGPDLVVRAAETLNPERFIIYADADLLADRAAQLKIELSIIAHDDTGSLPAKPCLRVRHLPVIEKVIPQQLNAANSEYVVECLCAATRDCLSGYCQAIVTAPLHKAIINQAGIDFVGHTELLAEMAEREVVMMLASDELRVALVTTHLPLTEVPAAVTAQKLRSIIEIVRRELQQKFAIAEPRIAVAGLNPHAGEQGQLGCEEIAVIEPVIKCYQQKGWQIEGPFPADTLFTSARRQHYDVMIGMYHDQVLPVIKALSFGHCINITLGLPFVRTSVDHGTALPLAGTAKAELGSFLMALQQAEALCMQTQHVTHC